MVQKYQADIKIYGIHKRDFLIEPLKERLGLSDDDICYDDRNMTGVSCLYTLAKACSAPIPDGITHRLVMPDDMVVCENFRVVLSKIINAHPDNFINLWAFRYNMFYKYAKVLKTPYIHSLGGTAGNGVVVPVYYLQSMVDWWKNQYGDEIHTYRSEAALVGWIKNHLISVITTIPSPVQHVGDDYGTFLPYKVTTNRKTVYFREDCLTGVDWDSKEVAWLPSFKYYKPSSDHYVRVPLTGLLEENECFNPRKYII